MAEFIKLFGLTVRFETYVFLHGGLVGTAIATAVAPLKYRAARPRHRQLQYALALQRQHYEARSETDRIDSELCQKWAGRVDPGYWK